MRTFKNVKGVGTRLHEEAGFECMCYEDDKGRDWYLVRKEWTGGVIAVWPEEGSYVGSYCEVALDYVPIPGQTLYEVDPETVPHRDDVMKLLGFYTYDGSDFAEVKQSAPAPRTKEDILADLIKLQEELKAL